MNGDSYTHTTAHDEVDGFRYDPVNLDRYIPLWRRIWWRLRWAAGKLTTPPPRCPTVLP